MLTPLKDAFPFQLGLLDPREHPSELLWGNTADMKLRWPMRAQESVNSSDAALILYSETYIRFNE